MSRQYPIWMDITSCIYQSDKSYGIRKTGITNVKVGTSSQNSHQFAEIKMTHRDLGKEGKSFRLTVDGEIIKEAIVKDGKITFTNPALTINPQ